MAALRILLLPAMSDGSCSWKCACEDVVMEKAGIVLKEIGIRSISQVKLFRGHCHKAASLEVGREA